MVNLIKDGFTDPSHSTTAWKDTAKGRSTCRECGSKISRGDPVLKFFGTLDGGYDPWRAVEASVCEPCTESNGWKENA